jgi:hypothetical protein
LGLVFFASAVAADLATYQTRLIECHSVLIVLLLLF